MRGKLSINKFLSWFFQFPVRSLTRTRLSGSVSDALVFSLKCYFVSFYGNKSHPTFFMFLTLFLISFLRVHSSNFYKLKQCLMTNGRKLAVCDDRRLNTIDSFMQALTGNLLRLACNEYPEDSDKCAKIISMTPPKPTSAPRARSFFLPMTQIVSSMRRNGPNSRS